MGTNQAPDQRSAPDGPRRRRTDRARPNNRRSPLCTARRPRRPQIEILPSPRPFLPSPDTGAAPPEIHEAESRPPPTKYRASVRTAADPPEQPAIYQHKKAKLRVRVCSAAAAAASSTRQRTDHTGGDSFKCVCVEKWPGWSSRLSSSGLRLILQEVCRQGAIRQSQRLVPTLRGDPAWILRHFELAWSFRRPSFNAAQYGKSQKRPAGRQFPLNSAKETGKACPPRACALNRHAGVWAQASPARKFEAQLPQSRGENSRTNATDEPKF